MDIVSFSFVALFCVLGAVIAYGADVLGRNIGKKRLSVGRLRPRHTAALATAVAGFLLPLVTVGLVTATSSDVRTWLVEGRRAVEERNRLVLQRDAIEGEVAKLQAERNRAEADVRKRNVQIADLRTQATSLRAEADRLRQELPPLRAQLSRSEARLRSIRANYVRLERSAMELTARNRQLFATNDRYGDENRLLGEQNLSLRTQLTESEREIARRQEQISNLNGRIDATQSELKTLGQALDDTLKRFAAEREAQRTTLEMERQRAEGELARLRLMQGELSQGLDANLRITRTLAMTYGNGDEVSRLVVPAGAGRRQAQEAVTSLLRTARNAAREKGAGPRDESLAAAGLIDVPLASGQILTAAAQEGDAVEAIARERESTVLVATAFWNAFEGEFVPLRLQVFRNPIVYNAGQLVAEARISGGQSEEEVLSDLRAFFGLTLRARAIADRMIPPFGRESTLGEVPLSTLMRLVREIRETNRLVRLVAIAPESIRAADPLRLEYRIR